MKTILLLVTLCLFKGYSVGANKCQTVHPPDPASKCCGQGVPPGRVPRGIGQKQTEIDEYPWLILLEFHDKHNETKLLCTGSLISSRYVLTAGQCVTGAALTNFTPKSIRLGEYNKGNDISSADCIQTAEGGTDCADLPLSIPIESITLHPEYNGRARKNDIALIRLQTAAPYTDFIRPICLPTTDITKGPKQTELWTTGWSEEKTAMNYKLHTHLPYVPLEDCAPKFNKGRISLWEKHICAGGEDVIDICKGNSGAPLMLAKDGHFELVGLVSFGMPCQLKNPDVYTNIYAYNDWIRSTIVD